MARAAMRLTCRDVQDSSSWGQAMKHGLISLTAAATIALPFLTLPAEVDSYDGEWRAQSDSGNKTLASLQVPIVQKF